MKVSAALNGTRATSASFNQVTPLPQYSLLGSQASLTPPRRRTTHWMTWLLRWPEMFLAVLVAALEAYRFGSTTTPMVSHAAWTPQRKLEMR
jgi:hypothetical protein